MAESKVYGEGDISGMLVSLLASLATEGDQPCSIRAYIDRSIPIALARKGVIDCGSKRITVAAIHQGDNDNMQIEEAIGLAPNE